MSTHPTAHRIVNPVLEHALALAGSDASPSRQRQLRWVAGELTQAMTVLDWYPTSPEELFAGDFLGQYLTAAEEGRFRQRAASRSEASAQASARVRRSCLTALATASGIAAQVVPATGSSTDPCPGADPVQIRRALDWWWAEACAPDAVSATVRAAAVAHLVTNHGLRTGELCTMTLDDLDLTTGRLRYTPMPQASRTTHEPVWLELGERGISLLRIWLRHRGAATALTPHITSLWVTLAGNHLGDRVLPAGLPLQPRGILRAHSSAVERLNAALAGTSGWKPLSAILADLRRPTPEETDG